MTENEALTIDEIIEHCNRTCENTEMLAIARGQSQEDITSKGYWEHYQVANYLEELKQYRVYKEIFESHFSQEAFELLSDEVEFGKWLERGKWIAKRCDEINRELEAYRAIGTVARFEQLSKQFAPHNTDETSCNLRNCNKCDMYRKENEKYHAIGTIDEFKALKEKSVAKKPILRSRGVYDEDNEDYLGEEEYMICPSCEIRWEVFRNQTHCRRCNQKLDWND